MKVYAWPLCVVAWVLVCRNINDSALAELLTDVGIALITLFFSRNLFLMYVNVSSRIEQKRVAQGILQLVPVAIVAAEVMAVEIVDNQDV